MKYLFCFLLIFAGNIAFSQQLASVFNSVHYNPMQYHATADSGYETKTHIHGSRGLIIGGSMLGIGSGLVVGSARSLNTPTVAAPFLATGGLLVTAGFITTILSAIVYAADKPSYTNYRHYSVYRQDEKVGIAYNF